MIIIYEWSIRLHAPCAKHPSPLILIRVIHSGEMIMLINVQLNMKDEKTNVYNKTCYSVSLRKGGATNPGLKLHYIEGTGVLVASKLLKCILDIYNSSATHSWWRI